MKFSIIMPCYQEAHNLPKAIGSVLDQDYPDKEIIVILDGEDRSARAVLKVYPMVKVGCTEAPRSGAPRARNIGASMAAGDVFVFLDPDTILYPGALTDWAEAFDEHPDYGYLYSGYKIKGQGTFTSEPFDPYFLKINNYINGMNPIRRTAFVGWDEKCKSLQDWDMFLTMTERGIKGWYLGENVCYYETDNVKPTGISMDSHLHWIERKEYIQKKHNLPIRDICVTSLAAPDHARRIAKLLDIDYVDYNILFSKPHKYKVIYQLGMFPGNGVRNYLPFYDSKTAYFKKDLKMAIHWIGTDIYQMQYKVPLGLVKQLVPLYNTKFTQFCQSKSNFEELREMGFDVKLCPLPIDVPNINPLPYPKDFTVAIYNHGGHLQVGEGDIYCYPLMMDVVKALPDIKFVMFGSDLLKGTEKNLTMLGRVRSVEEVIAKSSCLLRIVRHDGFPVSPVEFLSHNRPVITNNDFKYQRKIDFDGILTENSVPKVKRDIINAIRALQTHIPYPEYFEEAKAYYKNLLSPMALRAELDTITEGVKV